MCRIHKVWHPFPTLPRDEKLPLIERSVYVLSHRNSIRYIIRDFSASKPRCLVVSMHSVLLEPISLVPRAEVRPLKAVSVPRYDATLVTREYCSTHSRNGWCGYCIVGIIGVAAIGE